MILNLICLQLIIVFIIDLCGFIPVIRSTFYKLLYRVVFKTKPLNTISFENKRLKPFDCSLCMTHHILLLYVIFTSKFTIPIYLLICLLAYLTPSSILILTTLKDLIDNLFIKLNEKINKINYEK